MMVHEGGRRPHKGGLRMRSTKHTLFWHCKTEDVEEACSGLTLAWLSVVVFLEVLAEEGRLRRTWATTRNVVLRWLFAEESSGVVGYLVEHCFGS